MKKQLLILALAGTVPLAFNSCDKPAPGMGAAATSAASTPTAAPAPVPASSAPKAATPAPTAPTPAPTTPTTTVTPAPEVKPAPAAPTGPSVKVKPVMPDALFAGTPLPDNNNVPNMDKPGTPAVLSADLPEGCTLLSLKAPVTSSCPSPFTGTLDMVTDSEKDGSDGYFVELDPGKQWVQIDLGATKEVWGLWVWHFHKNNVIYKGVVIQVSDDPEFKTATVIYNNDFDNSVGLGVGKDNSYVETNNGRFVAGKGTKGRYVRLWSNGRYQDEMNHYIEVEIYGK